MFVFLTVVYFHMQPRIDGYFDRIHTIIARGKISPRVKFMLKDVLELRENNWVPRRQLDTTPKTIDQVYTYILVHMGH